MKASWLRARLLWVHLAVALVLVEPAQSQPVREVLDASGPFLSAEALYADELGRVDVFMDRDLVRFVPSAGTRRLGWDFGGLRDPMRESEGTVVVVGDGGAGRLRLDDSGENLVGFAGDGTTPFIGGTEVALSPDGTMHFLASTGLFRRDPLGGVSLEPITNAAHIAAGQDGSLWWTSERDALVRRVAPGGSSAVVYDGTGGGAEPALGLISDLAIDAQGNAWLTDSSNQLVRVAPDGAAQVMLSSAATGTGPPIDRPNLVRAGADGSLWVSAGDDRILRIAADGEVRIVLERGGDGAHGFSQPRDLALDAAGNAYVCGFGSRNAFRIAPDGSLTHLIDASGDGVTALLRPTSVQPDGAGGVFVGDLRGSVFHVAAAGAVSLVVPPPHPDPIGFQIAAMAIGADGDLFFSRNNLPGILRLRATGEIEVFWAQFNVDVMVSDGDGALIVARTIEDHVQRIAQDGTLSHLMGSNGDGLGNPLSDPNRIALAPDGTLYVSSYWGNSLFRRTPDGLVTHLPRGSAFERPSGIAVDSEGRLFVSGAESDNVVRRDLDGSFHEVLHGESLGSGPHFLDPRDLAIDPNGDVFVSADRSRNVFRVRPDGSASEVIAPSGAGMGHELIEPIDVAVAPSGVVYVLGAAGRVLRADLRNECGDGIDNDADGAIDADDPSCGVGSGERDPTLACDDGLDNDRDGTIDAADPFCSQWVGNAEAPQCSDGYDNDGDGGVDWDGVGGTRDADPHCRSSGQFQESPPPSCGLGAELALFLAGWWGWRRRRSH
jgi:DNA-binding beta-propeller fold protein YncE